MRHDDFEEGFRRALTTLAREAVPDDVAVADDLPRVQPIGVGGGRRSGRRAMAAVVALVVAVGAGAVALATHRDRHLPRNETPLPTWTRVAPFPLLARSYQTAVFTGHQVIVWGGRAASVGAVAPAVVPPDAQGDGAAYDVDKNDWSVLPQAPIGARYEAVAAWTGTEMLVVGGKRDGTGPGGAIEFLNDGAAYDPAHRSWRRLPAAPGCPFVGAWTGKQLVVAGECANTTRKFVTAEYDPVRNRWTTLPTFPDTMQLVSAGGRVFVWNSVTNRAAVLDAQTRTWSVLPVPPAPAGALLQSSLAVAYNGQLAVGGLEQMSSENHDRAVVNVLDLTTRTWRHFESATARAPMEGLLITSGVNVLLWSDGLGASWFVGRPLGAEPEWSNTGPGPVELGSSGESLVPIGPRRFFIWGGRLAGTAQDPTNRPTPEGAILELP